MDQKSMSTEEVKSTTQQAQTTTGGETEGGDTEKRDKQGQGERLKGGGRKRKAGIPAPANNASTNDSATTTGQIPMIIAGEEEEAAEKEEEAQSGGGNNGAAKLLRVVTINTNTLAGKQSARAFKKRQNYNRQDDTPGTCQRAIKGYEHMYTRLPLYTKQCDTEDIDIVLMQETKLPQPVQPPAKHGYTFFGSGVKDGFDGTKKQSQFNAEKARRVQGVAILLRLKGDDYVEKVYEISPRLIWVAATVAGARVCVFSVYAPHNELPEDEREEFFEQTLREQIELARKLYPYHTIIAGGDYNARPLAGAPKPGATVVMGTYGATVEEQDANGELLNDMAAELSLASAGTFFAPEPSLGAGTWQDHISRDIGVWDKPAMDHILVPEKLIREDKVVKCGVNMQIGVGLGSDHRAVVAELWITTTISKTQKKKEAKEAREKRPKKKDYAALKEVKVAEKFMETVQRLAADEGSDDEGEEEEEGDLEGANDEDAARKRSNMSGAFRAAMEEHVPDKEQITTKKSCWFEDSKRVMYTLLGQLRDLTKELGRAKMKERLEDTMSFATRIEVLRIQSKLASTRQDLEETTARKQEEMWSKQAKMLNTAFDTHNTKEFYAGLRRLVGGAQAKTAATPLVLDTEGKATTTAEQSMATWKEYFNILLNQDGSAKGRLEDILSGVPTSPIQTQFEEDFTVEQFKTAVKAIKSDRAMGLDGIPIEAIKAVLDSEEICQQMVNNVNYVFKNGRDVPGEWKDVVISLIHKSGDTNLCTNYRGISIISHLGKAIELMVMQRITQHFIDLDGCIPDTQYGFMRNKSCDDAIMISRLLASSCIEQSTELHKAYIDFQKAYDRVDREVMWEILRRRGIPEQMVTFIKNFHEGAEARVRVNGVESETFTLGRGLKQGSIMSPILFNVYLGALFQQVHAEYDKLPQEEQDIIGIQYVTNPASDPTKLIYSNGNKSDTTVKRLLEIMYADDLMVPATSQAGLQIMMTVIDRVATSFGQLISTTKTQVMKVAQQLKEPAKPREVNQKSKKAKKPKNAKKMAAVMAGIYIFAGTDKPIDLELVEKFKYLGALDNNTATMAHEISRRISSMCYAFGRLRPTLTDHKLKLATRIDLFNAVVLGGGVYSAASWSLTAAQTERMESLHFRFLKRIMHQSRDTSREQCIKIAAAHNIIIIPLQIRIQHRVLSKLGEIERQSDDNTIKNVLHGSVQQGDKSKHGSGCPYRHTLVKALNSYGLTEMKWRDLIKDAPKFRRHLAEEGKVHAMRQWLERHAKVRINRKINEERSQERVAATERQLEAAIQAESDILYVQCDDCDAWRRWRGTDAEHKALPAEDMWYCYMNTHDSMHKSCTDAEEDFTDTRGGMHEGNNRQAREEEEEEEEEEATRLAFEEEEEENEGQDGGEGEEGAQEPATADSAVMREEMEVVPEEPRTARRPQESKEIRTVREQRAVHKVAKEGTSASQVMEAWEKEYNKYLEKKRKREAGKGEDSKNDEPRHKHHLRRGNAGPLSDTRRANLEGGEEPRFTHIAGRPNAAARDKQRWAEIACKLCKNASCRRDNHYAPGIEEGRYAYCTDSILVGMPWYRNSCAWDTVMTSLFVTYARFGAEGRALWTRTCPTMATVFQDLVEKRINNIQAKERLQPLFEGKYSKVAEDLINKHSDRISTDDIYRAVMAQMTEGMATDGGIQLFNFTRTNRTHCHEAECNSQVQPNPDEQQQKMLHDLIPYPIDSGKWEMENAIQRSMRSVTNVSACKSCGKRSLFNEKVEGNPPAIIIALLPVFQDALQPPTKLEDYIDIEGEVYELIAAPIGNGSHFTARIKLVEDICAYDGLRAGQQIRKRYGSTETCFPVQTSEGDVDSLIYVRKSMLAVQSVRKVLDVGQLFVNAEGPYRGAPRTSSNSSSSSSSSGQGSTTGENASTAPINRGTAVWIKGPGVNEKWNKGVVNNQITTSGTQNTTTYQVRVVRPTTSGTPVEFGIITIKDRTRIRTRQQMDQFGGEEPEHSQQQQRQILTRVDEQVCKDGDNDGSMNNEQSEGSSSSSSSSRNTNQQSRVVVIMDTQENGNGDNGGSNNNHDNEEGGREEGEGGMMKTVVGNKRQLGEPSRDEKAAEKDIEEGCDKRMGEMGGTGEGQEAGQRRADNHKKKRRTELRKRSRQEQYQRDAEHSGNNSDTHPMDIPQNLP